MTITTKRRIRIDTDGRITGRGRHIADRKRDYRIKKMRREDGRARSDLVLRVDSPSCAVQPRNGTAARAHFGLRGLGAQNGPARHEPWDVPGDPSPATHHSA